MLQSFRGAAENFEFFVQVGRIIGPGLRDGAVCGDSADDLGARLCGVEAVAAQQHHAEDRETAGRVVGMRRKWNLLRIEKGDSVDIPLQPIVDFIGEEFAARGRIVHKCYVNFRARDDGVDHPFQEKRIFEVGFGHLPVMVDDIFGGLEELPKRTDPAASIDRLSSMSDGFQ